MDQLIYANGMVRDVKITNIKFSPEQHLLFSRAVLALAENNKEEYERFMAVLKSEFDPVVIEKLAFDEVKNHDPEDKVWEIGTDYMICE